ncbi:conserved hypothetical protein [Talaromyces stipitatus ATCC 10500]|uniref:Peptidyl-tRNA hydrolase n=1 Tax=Talaromyces stipitatus (strain ATCC 10500 / CBS 375.48 / QM 6759 / NRRL 1006) TaxID=441959 RepID=B8LWS0_TALSN|nr:uncharacterized protein TSTA_078300 [Talaromyces stipitatus ATCC 10500]EED24467.1 conserved hypothetical protein [Talaromyces stipitatus ATCC 10500]
MRFSALITLLPVLVAAQESQYAFTDQVKGWFDQVKSFIPQAPIVANPVQEAVHRTTSKVAEKAVTPVTLNNYKDVLEPSTQPQEWLVFFTGGNKTCFGRCLRAEHAWNDSIPLFAADPTSPNLGYVDCEKEAILCSILAAAAPTIWHLDLPQVHPGEKRPEVPLHVVHLNFTTVTPETVYNVHAEKTWQKEDRYEGWLHPYDSFLAETGLNVPLGHVIYYFSVIPSWLTMIGISFLSRNVMGRRAANPGAIAGRR